MRKAELVYLELLSAPKGGRLTQLGIARGLGVSLSVVNNALEPLRLNGAVSVRRRGLDVTDKEKLLMHWANHRNLRKDVVYETRAELRVTDIEKAMPSGTAFTACSGYRLRYGDAPADYSEVFVYADEETVSEIWERFPPRKGPPNLIVLKASGALLERCTKNVVPDAVLFVDLWNSSEWYARDFLNALKKRLFEGV